MKYAVRYGAEAKLEFRHEFNWSVRHWGKVHALHFFKRVRSQIIHLAELPFAYRRPEGTKADYRVIHFDGLRVAYHVDEKKMVVTVLAIVGRNHYHEIEEKAMRALMQIKE